MSSGAGTVLVIDDEESIVSIAAVLLGTMDFSALTASDGQEGLELLARAAPMVDLVLVDLTMPGVDGEQVLEEVRRRWPSLPVVLMSGVGADEMRDRFAHNPPASFLQKPFTRSELASALEEALAGRGGKAIH